MEWVKYLIAISGVLLVTQFAGANTAYATSDYDNLIQNTSDLKVTYSGHSDLDVSNNYMGYFKNTITDDVAQYECHSPSSDTDPTNCNQIINDSLDHGDWLIAAFPHTYPVDYTIIDGQFCDQKVTSITGETDAYFYGTYKTLYGNTTAPANCVAVNLGYQHYTNGTHLVVSAQGWANLTTSAIELNGTMTTGSGTINQGYLYFFTSTANYPEGYEGEVPPTSEPLVRYVAMGDSFSSGEGNPLFEQGSDTSSDSCHRSSGAYPRLLESDNSLDLGRTSFVACSGATTYNVLNGQDSESPQINSLSADTQTVTITIGGNDVGFADYALACTETLCGPNTFDYNYIMDSINDPDFTADLADTYNAILDNAPNAEIYVVGYPYLAAPSSSACGSVDLTGAYDVQNQLNSVIAAKVSDVAATRLTTRLHYIDPNISTSPFTNKYLCNGGAEDFNGLDLVHPKYSFHPNIQGHEDFASVIKSAL